MEEGHRLQYLNNMFSLAIVGFVEAHLFFADVVVAAVIV